MDFLTEWKKRDPLLADMDGYTKFVEKYQAKEQLVQQFLENERKTQEIHEQCHEQSKQANEQVRKVKDMHYDKLKVLQEERDGAIALIHEGLGLEREEADREIGELSKVITRVYRILAFLKLKTKDLTIKDEDVKVYHDRHIESLGYFFNDDYLKVKLFIAENSKPKNKYALVAVGKCFFTEKVMNLRPYHGYGVDVSYTGRCNIQLVIKEAPEICDLHTYFEKWREKILAGLLAKYKLVKAEYLGILAEYNLELFEPLMAYRCTACGWFLTRGEVKRWTRLDDECPKCGKRTLLNFTRVNSLDGV